ncbi:MAG: COG3014 family protein [Flavobacteriales bacterium]
MSQEFQNELENGQLDQAYDLVKKNKFLKKRRNRVLAALERGKLAHLNGYYEESNRYFNQVDSILDLNKKNIGGKLLANFTNPEKAPYRAEDFEQVFIHYYKALNYYNLNQFDEALVEARRINLRLQAINDSYPADKKNRYNTDAFAHMFQGFLYECMNETNEAYISYKLATEVYLGQENHHFFGVDLPDALAQDLLSSAKTLGFREQYKHYSKTLDQKAKQVETSPGGELILIWEQGLVPYKAETNFMFSMLPNGYGSLDIVSDELGLSIPMAYSGNQSNFDIIRLAFPQYQTRFVQYDSAQVSIEGKTYDFVKIENFDVIAQKTLEDRRVRDLTSAALRLATKKVAESLVSKENEYAGDALKIINMFTEKADTRNWQTLPSALYYTRIPLEKGENTIQVKLSGNLAEKTQTITANGKGGTQLKTLYSF